jgi:hypothetical protein
MATSLFEWQASVTVGAAKNLAHWILRTRTDKLRWRPSTDPESESRNIFEQMEECVRVNRLIARWLQDDLAAEVKAVQLDSAEQTMAELVSSAEQLAAVIRDLNESVLARVFETQWGPLSGRELIVIPMANMYYHGGQVNFVQCLYGDTEMHFPD